MKRIGVFCGSRSGKKECYIEKARSLGKELVKNNLSIVYGGSSVGLMGAIADEVVDNGGEAIGIIPRVLVKKEVAHHNITKLYTVDSMHERKYKMYELSDAFIIMPGGIGTMDEFFEVITWISIGEHNKPCAIFNIDNYFSPLIKLLEHMIEQEFLNEEVYNKIIFEKEEQKLMDNLKNYFKS